MWQKIETAPKDGTKIVIGGKDWEGKFEMWWYAEWNPDSKDGEWYGPWSDGCTSGIPDWRFVPTHWMPLPDPPNNTERDNDEQRR